MSSAEDFETVSLAGESSNSDDSLSSSSSSSSSSSDDYGRHPRVVVPVFMGELPQSISHARSVLATIFYRIDWHNLEGRSFVLKILTQYPALATETFEDPDGEPRRPLSQFLSARAGLEIIQTIYEMHEEAISIPQGSIGDLPLHDACWYGTDTDVVKFIATEYPEALTIPNGSRRLPVHDALRSSRMSMEGHDDNLTNNDTIRFLLEMYPDSMKVKDNDGKSILESALYHGYEPQLLTFMIDQYPSSMDTFQASGGYYVLDLPRAQAMDKLLPRIKSFRCDPLSWTPDGFVTLMNSLANNSSLEFLEMPSFPGDLFVDNQDAQRSFLHFLEQNCRLFKLNIVIPGGQASILHNVADECLRVMGAAFENNINSGLQRLELGRMVITNRYNLANFLLSAQAPRELVLEQVTIRLASGLFSTLPEDPQGLIESVIFSNCPMNQSTVEDIFELLAMMPSLKALKLEFNPSAPGAAQVADVNLTNPLITVLQQTELEHIELSLIFTLDMDPLVEVLKNNTSLETLRTAPRCLKADALLKILEQNTTLKDCGLEPAGRHDRVRDKALQMMRLNRFGRGRVREAGTSKMQFLDILVAANTDISLKLPINKFNIMLGLLRESPTLWCDIQ